MSLVLATVLMLASWQGDTPEQAVREQRVIAAALAFDPRTLPSASAEQWSAWKPQDEIPEPVRARLAAGRAAYIEADYGRAIAHLVALLKEVPDYPAALYQLGSAYFRLRRYGDCSAVMERFVRAAPREIGASQALGHSYYSLGRYEQAREHYRKVVAAAPTSVEAWRGLGLAHMRLGDSTKALECLTKSLELKPEHADARGWLAQVLWDVGRVEEALAAVERARDLAPHEPRHWFLLARIYGDLGRDEQATSASERFRELNRIAQEIRTQEGLLLHNPRAIEPLRRLVALQCSARNADETRDAVQRLMRTAPGELEHRVLALEALHALQDRDAATVMAAEIERVFFENSQAWKLLAEYYAEVGDSAGLVRARERLSKLGVGK